MIFTNRPSQCSMIRITTHSVSEVSTTARGSGWPGDVLSIHAAVMRIAEPPATRAVVLTPLPLKVVIRNAISTGIRAASYIASQQLPMGFFEKTLFRICVWLRLCCAVSQRLLRRERQACANINRVGSTDNYDTLGGFCLLHTFFSDFQR